MTDLKLKNICADEVDYTTVKIPLKRGEPISMLTHVSTSDLVRELAGREEVSKLLVENSLKYNIEQGTTDNNGIGHYETLYIGEGPATILVVRGERE